MVRKMIKVKTLYNSAFELVYRLLISEFSGIFRKKNNVAYLEGPPSKVSRTESCDDYVLSEAKRNKALDDIRQKLDENLIGKYSDERKKILDRFLKSYNTVKQCDVDYNLCLAFFNCLLDESFTDFDLTGGEQEYHPFKNFDPLEVVPVISRRSPNLKLLSLSFASLELVTTMITPLCTSLKTYNFLTSLTLSSPWATRIAIDYLPLFISLGQSCPNLICLHFAGNFAMFLNLQHLLALVLGKKIELLPQQLVLQLNSNNSSVAHMQFTPQSVTPICSSLQQLGVYCLGKEEAAFALRHFPKLKKCQAKSIEGGDGEAILLLHRQKKESSLICPTNHLQSSKSLGLIEWTLDAPFQGIDTFVF